MIIVPENFDQFGEDLKVSDDEAAFLSILKTVLDNDALILLKIYPAAGVKADMCLIEPQMGAYFIFTVTPTENLSKALNVYEHLLNPQFQKKIVDRICSHRQLSQEQDGEKHPTIPLGFVWFIPNFKRKDAHKNRFAEYNCMFADDLHRFTDKKRLFRFLEGTRMPRMFVWDGFSEGQINAFFYCTAPEYRIPKFQNNVDDFFNDWKLDLNEEIAASVDGKNISFKALALTESQVEMVNNLHKGPQLILSCAGSGKSIMLAARALKTAKAYPDKLVLLTCYNRTLQEYIEFCIDAAGLKSKNLICRTFHGLCRYLLESNDLPVPPAGTDSYFDDLCTYLESALKNGKIGQSFYAVFIDEIQDFKTEWYQLCLNLIESKSDYILNVCGDKSQDVYQKLSKNKVPWEEGPDCEANKFRLEQNYRSTDQINYFTNTFGRTMKTWVKGFKNSIPDKSDLFLPAKPSGRQGPSPKVHYVKSLDGENKKTLEILRKLHDEYKIAYSDMAVLFPYRKAEAFNIFTQHFLTKQLDMDRIPYTVLGGGDLNDFPSNFADRSGVTLSTIYASKGVDFKAVIVCGLRPLRPTIFSITADKEEHQRLYSNLLLLYTAATRAEEHLHWVLSQNPAQSVYSKIIQNCIDAVSKSQTKADQDDAPDVRRIVKIINKYKR